MVHKHTVWHEYRRRTVALIYKKSDEISGNRTFILAWAHNFQRDFEAAHYGKLGDNAAFSIAGFYSGSNGFFKNQTTGNRADNYNEAGGKARFVSRLTDRFTIDFTADYQYVNQNAFPYVCLT